MDYSADWLEMQTSETELVMANLHLAKLGSEPEFGCSDLAESTLIVGNADDVWTLSEIEYSTGAMSSPSGG